VRVIVSEATVKVAIENNDELKLQKLIAFSQQTKRHFISFESAQSLNQLLDTFNKKVQAAYRSLLDTSMREGLLFPGTRATLRIDPIAPPIWNQSFSVLPLDDALKVLDEKIIILVENSTSDWNFLRGVMPQRSRKLFQEYVDNDWAAPLHGGGDTLGELLTDRLKTPWKALQTFVLFDSDRLHPDELDPNWTPIRPGRNPAACKAYEWVKLLQSNNIFRYWMLNRRFIESYMPKEELILGAENKTHQDAVSSFFSMGPDLRWYYNMKEGFTKDRGRNDSERSRDLYSNISAEIHTSLGAGFGKTLARHYRSSLEKEFAWDEDARNEANIALPRLLNML
jgi:hypothetical protein